MLLTIQEMIWAVFNNRHIKVALVSMLIAQILKIIFYYMKNRRFNFKVFVQSSGMPSSHTAMVTALTVSVGLADGWNSVTYAIALIFSVIVMYDAAGVRRAAGKQAIILNKILDDLTLKGHIKEKRLREFLGHTPLEVFFGALLGLAIAFIYNFK